MPTDGSATRLSVEKYPESQPVLHSREGGEVLGEAGGVLQRG